MAIQDEIRTDLENEVFSEFGKTVTFIKLSTPTYNSRGEVESSTETQSSITIVPYDIIHDRRNRQPFGDLKEGEMAAAVRYTDDVAKDDKFIIESENWKVIEVSKNYLPDNVVTIIRLARDQYVADDD